MPRKKVLEKSPMILQHDLEPMLDLAENRTLRHGRPTEFTDVQQLEWAKDILKKDVTFNLPGRLVLSGANMMVKDKGHLNVISGRHVFPENPSIEFMNDRNDFYGGKVEIWLENLIGPKKLQFVIRMTGYAGGGATITLRSSYPTLYSLTPIQTSGSMNYTLGNIVNIPSKTQGGLGLVSLEVQFHNAHYGSWSFRDVKITEVT